MTEGEYAHLAVVLVLGLMRHCLDDLGAILRTTDHGEDEVGILRGVLAPLLGRARVEDRQLAVERLGQPFDMLQLEEATVPVEFAFRCPNLAHDVQPLLSQRIARVMVLRKIHAERVVLGLVPSGNNVDTSATLTDLIDRSHLLGHDDRVIERRVDGREAEDALGVGEQARGPHRGVQHTFVEVGLAAVADPSSDGQQEVDADLVGDLGHPQVVIPAS